MARLIRTALAEPVPRCVESNRCPAASNRAVQMVGATTPGRRRRGIFQAASPTRGRSIARALLTSSMAHRAFRAFAIPFSRDSFVVEPDQRTIMQRKHMSTISRRLPTRWTAQHAAGGLLLVIAILLQRIVSAASGQWLAQRTSGLPL